MTIELGTQSRRSSMCSHLRAHNRMWFVRTSTFIFRQCTSTPHTCTPTLHNQTKQKLDLHIMATLALLISSNSIYSSTTSQQCDATKKFYQNMACCGSGTAQVVCNSASNVSFSDVTSQLGTLAATRANYMGTPRRNSSTRMHRRARPHHFKPCSRHTSNACPLLPRLRVRARRTDTSRSPSR